MPLTETPYLAMALNNAWANATFFRACADLSDAAFTAPAPGFFDSLSRTLNHIYEVDLYYIDGLEQGGLGRAVFDRQDITNPVALAIAQAAADLRLASFCKTLTAATLKETRVIARKHGDTHERVDALLMHLFQHQIHHRGQAHTQLHHLGIVPPQLDDFYLNDGRVPSARAYWS